MRVQIDGQDQITHQIDLIRVDTALNLTADPWQLPENVATRIVGRDVIHRGRIAPDGGRKSILASGTSNSICLAFQSRMYGNVAVRFTDIYDNVNYSAHTVSTLKATTTLLPSGWPVEMVGGLFIVNEDERKAAPQVVRIKSVTTVTNPNDTLTFDTPLSTTMTIWYTKFSILYNKLYDKRGAWGVLSSYDGIVLWQAAAVNTYQNFSGSALGSTENSYRGCPIGNRRFLFVSPVAVPRVVDLSDSVDASAEGGFAYDTRRLSRLAGMFPPFSPMPSNPWANNRSVTYGGLNAEFVGSTDATKWLSPSVATRIKVRGVNRETGQESQFVDAKCSPNPDVNSTGVMQIGWTFADATISGGTNLDSSVFSTYQYVSGDTVVILGPTADIGEYAITGLAGTVVQTGHAWSGAPVIGYIKTGNQDLIRGTIDFFTKGTELLCPWDPKWTHLEVWRTNAAGTVYYHEADIVITGPWDSEGTANNEPTLVFTGQSTWTPNRWTGYLTDDGLTGQTPLTTTDFLSGRLPPLCKRAVNLKGVTIFAGAGQSTPKTETLWSYGFRLTTGTSWDTATKKITCVGGFTDYVFQSGDVWVFDNPAASTNLIVSRVSNDEIQLGTNLVIPTGAVSGYIMRPQTIDWPRIASDELVYHSRVDKFAPESVMADPIRLSNVGDRYQNHVVAKGYCVVVMRGGVHILYLSNGSLELETVAADGEGTPWPDSVVVLESTVLWATPRGIRVLRLYASPNADGNRGDLDWLDKDGAFTAWFEEAATISGLQIDAGVDTTNNCIRFRRRYTTTSPAADRFEVLQICYRTGLATIIEGDSGSLYVPSVYVDSVVKDTPALYSFQAGTNANFFEVNYYGLTQPYYGSMVQMVLADGVHTVTTTRITRLSGSQFYAGMVGDVVTFRSTNPLVNGVTRVITAATTNYIEFDTMSTVAAYGDTFIIGNSPYRIRMPFTGEMFANVKHIHALAVKAIPGPRNTGGSSRWPLAAPGYFTVRVLRENLETVMAEQALEIPILPESEVTGLSTDEQSAITGDGRLLAIEIEMSDARTDFRIQRAQAVVMEDGDTLADASASA